MAGMPANNMPLPNQPSLPITTGPTNLGNLADIFSGLGMTSTVGTSSYVPPNQVFKFFNNIYK